MRKAWWEWFVEKKGYFSLWILMYALQKACSCYLNCHSACIDIFVENVFAITRMLDKCRHCSSASRWILLNISLPIHNLIWHRVPWLVDVWGCKLKSVTFSCRCTVCCKKEHSHRVYSKENIQQLFAAQNFRTSNSLTQDECAIVLGMRWRALKFFCERNCLRILASWVMYKYYDLY